MILFDGLSMLLFVLSVLYLVWIFRRESRHQRTLGWPQAPATLAEGPDRLCTGYRDAFRYVNYYRAELEQPYVFYARGARYTGNRLAPGMRYITESDASLFLRELGQSRRYNVVFNPDNPTDNYLTGGTEIMGYLELFLLATVGIVLPYMIYASPAWRGILTGEMMILLLLFVPVLALISYHSAKPPVQLAQRLSPCPILRPGAQNSGDEVASGTVNDQAGPTTRGRPAFENQTSIRHGRRPPK
ncbi:hypothetical protein CLV84_1190 [Neolewinella xylanilytica]|uniref:DUF3592 domain-containing protein n=1 Tax=Neolewinella xylanilytica TaxID=1514080 RepID=A0A2S6I9P9_9BACT|nr:hypothetical protein [Neolewinella xylanilytica]PPK88225.1 hypothetical protein CLV84_1190 [Neolewinella xylanilytica]